MGRPEGPRSGRQVFPVGTYVGNARYALSAHCRTKIKFSSPVSLVEFSGPLLRLLTHFLDDRTLLFSITLIKAGTPQGSILAHLLFEISLLNKLSHYVCKNCGWGHCFNLMIGNERQIVLYHRLIWRHHVIRQ